jgi:hypothetical protein
VRPNKDEVLILIKQVLETLETQGEITEREFQLAVLEALRYLLERDSIG